MSHIGKPTMAPFLVKIVSRICNQTSAQISEKLTVHLVFSENTESFKNVSRILTRTPAEDSNWIMNSYWKSK